ncbi:DsbA family protein [Candidatus Nomurabacteria bacterium]|nr:DsbA family protein [Candidatus Nomurabacteria bacterium]
MENNKLSVPAAIVIAGIIIAGAVIYNGQKASNGPSVPEFKPKKLLTIDNTDHIRGNPSAQITILEYSDLECPFCKQFHKTMEQVMKSYGNDVRWVYRHLPLEIHPKAQKEAEATECVAALGGEDKFWQYTDKIFDITPSNNGLDLALLSQLAEELGINRQAFDSCLTNGESVQRIKRDVDNAVETGAAYTPFSIIINKKDGAKELGGAMPFDKLEAILKKELGIE